MVGSVAAITEDGALVAASATGSQLGPVRRRRRPADPGRRQPEDRAQPGRGPAADHDVVFPYENAQVRERLGVDTRLEKVLIIYGEWKAGRTTVVLVREPVGV